MNKGQTFIGTWILALSFSLQAQSDPSFATIQIETDASYEYPLAERISFSLYTKDPVASVDMLKQWSGLEATVSDQNTVLVSMTKRPSFNGELDAKYQSDSFVIDISEHSTQAFIDGFNVPDTSSNIALNIEAYVSQFIAFPTYEHGFNIASKVAVNRSGDCTEYAVLTTALARALNIPARLMFGTVLIEDKNTVEAVGHAWTEIWHNEAWQIIDAALYGIEDTSPVSNRVYYLPISSLEDEGPGFSFSMMGSMMLMPYKIENLKSAL